MPDEAPGAERPLDFQPVRGVTVHPEGVVTFGEAAAVLGVAMPVVCGLVAQGILHTTAE
jgi:hypothetical protein